MKYWQKYIKGLKIFLPYSVYDELNIFMNDMLYSEMDMVICIDGKEGSGKSRTARLLGSYIASVTNVPFDVDNIHFTTKDYIKSSESGKKFQVNILDESREALNKKRGMSKSNVFFTNWLSENRDKQQVHILLLPAIHDIDNYIAIWRMSMLIHHIKWHNPQDNYKLVRGWAKVYGNDTKLQQVLHNKQRYGYYSYPKNYKYRIKFKDCEPFTEDQLVKYKDKKAKLRAEKYNSAMISKDRALLAKGLRVMNETFKVPQKDLATAIGISAGGVNAIIKEDRLLEEMQT